MAHYDSLTGLTNRAQTMSRLEAALDCSRDPGPELGVLFCDVDYFKTINDTWGHASGDAVLVTLAARIRECIRHGDTVGRTGGDEILVLLPDIHTLDEVAQIAKKIRSCAAEPMDHDGNTIHATLSIGATLAVPGESVATTTIAPRWESSRIVRPKALSGELVHSVRASDEKAPLSRRCLRTSS